MPALLSNVTPLARITAAHLGRYRRPFDRKLETDWIAKRVDLSRIRVVVSGAKGWPQLDPHYQAVVEELSRRAGAALRHQTYKQDCGEFYSASAVGFAQAVALAQQEKSAVLLYTLSLRGAKAMSVIEP